MQLPPATERASLAGEQAALRREASLRRIATLVAGGVTAEELFAAVAREVSAVLNVPVVTLGRYEFDGGSPVSVVLASRKHASFPVGSRWPLDGAGTREIYENRRPIRIEDFSGLDGTLARAARQQGMSWVVGAPIIVDGSVWGNIYAGTADDELIPVDAESRLADFTDLVSIAIANSDAQDRVRRLAEEQGALRRVATLVAQGSGAGELFALVSEEVGMLFDAAVSIGRYEPDGSAIVIVGVTPGYPPSEIGTRWELEDFLASTAVYRTGRPARTDYKGLQDASGVAADFVRALKSVSTVAAPIVVEGKLWGVIAVHDLGHSLPADTEERVGKFTELVATAIANAESRGELAASEERARGLAEEQAALRRVATLVAQGVQPLEIFSAVSEEVGRVFGSQYAGVARFEHDGSGVVILGVSKGIRNIPIGTRWPFEDFLATTAVYRTGHPARNERRDWEDSSGPVADRLRELGLVSTVAAPIVVEGNLWGAVTVSDAHQHLPPDTEERLAAFTELVATAIANAESRGELAASEARARELASEQAALRRVATLVAEGASPDELFSAVANEVGGVVDMAGVGIRRYEADGTFTVLGNAGESHLPVGSRWPVVDEGITGEILATGRPARRDDYTSIPDPSDDAVQKEVWTSTVGVPIVVEGSIWGIMGAADRSGRPIPVDIEERLARFTELVATAVANSQARERIAQLADEQAALRRVATLVAEGATPNRVFDAVRQEVARMFNIPSTILMRFDADGVATLLATYGDYLGPVGTRWPLEGDTSAVARVHQTGRAARADYTNSQHVRGSLAQAARRGGVRYPVAVPVVVEGALWGAMSAGSYGPAPPPPDLEGRLAKFTELLGTAIANAENRSDLAASEAHARELADEQAALRRVATLVAQGASPDELFSAVAKEVAGVIDAPVVGINRYEPDGTYTILGNAGESSDWIGTRWPVGTRDLTGMILATGRPSRQDDFIGIRGVAASAGDAPTESWREPRSMVGVPIMVEGNIWGVMSAVAAPGMLVPAGTEDRLARFTELLATAISNATVRTELLASRSRLVSAADETRRRLERDLHDGIQQWLVALALRARKAAGLSASEGSAAQELSGLADDLVAVTDELREISRGIHPAILSDAGLDDALESLARRSAIRVDLDVSFQGRYDPTLEATVYYVVAESITNAVKHARASTVTVRGGRRNGTIELEIGDNGVGGADPRRGTGLIGLQDRVDSLGGTISFASPVGAGTTIRVTLPAGPSDGKDTPFPRADEAAPPSGSG